MIIETTTADEERARLYEESVRRLREQAEAERRRAWITFHEDKRRLHSRLAYEHEAKAARLKEGRR